jgi:hypothetical protein
LELSVGGSAGLAPPRPHLRGCALGPCYWGSHMPRRIARAQRPGPHQRGVAARVHPSEGARAAPWRREVWRDLAKLEKGQRKRV